MYARMISAQLRPIEPQVVIPLPMGIVMELREQPGLADVLILTSHAENRLVLVSLWKTEAAMLAYEANPVYQQHVAKLEAICVGPLIQTSYDASFSAAHVSTVAHTAITGVNVLEPDQPQTTPPEQQPSLVSRPDWRSATSSFSQVHFLPKPVQAELLRVLPIARQEVHTGVIIMLLSLESYSDSFVIQGRLRTEQEMPVSPGVHSFPSLDRLEARDDRGNDYHRHQQSGGGNTRDWRFSYAFTPALDPAARALQIEIAELFWERFDHNTPERRHEREVQAGPWTFSIPLPPEKA
jgi:quinol monooxygenase YgiN